jgi:putative transposase
VQLSFKTELKPNNKQVALFRQHCRVAIYAYNWANGLMLEVLALRGTAQTVKLPTTIDLPKPLVAEIKNIYRWYYNSYKPSRHLGLSELITD